MNAQVNPDVLMDLKKFGVSDATVCFNCGNCTAVCELSSETSPFPRKVIRYLQSGTIYRKGEFSEFPLPIILRKPKSKPVYEHTHSSDWVFLIMLWLTAFSGILVHITRLLELPLTTYAIYVIHLMIAVPMLVIEVPFAKWTHQLYRPLILYLMKVRQSAARAEA